jgi:lysophospholipase L1-like esterase
MPKKRFIDFPEGTFGPSKVFLQADPTTGRIEKVILPAPLSANYLGARTPTSTPTNSGEAFWVATMPGTYTNFGNVVVDANSFAIIARDASNNFTISQSTLNDLSDYYNISGTDSAISTQLINTIGSSTSTALVSEPLAIDNSAFYFNHTNDVFSGEAWAIGNPQNFNQISFRIIANQDISNIYSVIKTVNKTGTIIGSKNISITIPNGSTQTVTITFDSVISNASGSQLYFMFATDGKCGCWACDNSHNPYPYPTYPIESYTTNGQTNFNNFIDVSNPSVSSIFLYTRIELVSLTINPNTVFAEKVAAASTTIQANKSDLLTLQTQVTNTNTLVNNAITSTTLKSNIFQSLDEANATFEALDSTFTGWGTTIGKPTNFNTIKFRIRTNSGASAAITKVKYWIVQDNPSGTILASNVVSGLNLAVGADQYITDTLSSTISNSGNNFIWFFWNADQLCDRYGLTNETNANTQNEKYFTNSFSFDTITPNGCMNATDNSRSDWVQTSLFTSNVPSPTTLFLQEIESQLPVPITNLPDIVTAQLILPSRIFAVEGKETNIYFADIITSNVKNSLLDFDITCAKGIQFDKFYRITPVASDAGSYSLTIDVYFAGKLITTATTTLYIVAANAASGVTRSVLGVGDSTLASGQPLSIILSEHSADVMTLTFKGTQGSGANKHEGHSGWKISDFATQGRVNYHFIVSGVTVAPLVSDYYSVGGFTFYVTVVSVTSGSGYIEGFVTSGTGTPAASGAITRVSGSGDTSISYSSYTTNYLNPFWNGSLNFANYLSTNSITLTSNDWVFIHLGINDVFNYYDDTSLGTYIDSMVSNLRTLITNMRSAVSGLRIALCVTIMPTISQDGFGHDYSSGQTLIRYITNVQTWQKRMISEFDNDTERTAGNYLIPWNAIIDRENNMQQALINANARNTTQILTYTNSVHPAQSGYDQMGDQLWAFLKYMA